MRCPCLFGFAGTSVLLSAMTDVSEKEKKVQLQLRRKRCDGQAEKCSLVSLLQFLTVFVIEKLLIRSHMLKQTSWRCEGPISAVQKVTGSQWASCRNMFSWSSINSVCRAAILTQGQILCPSIENSVTFLTRNGFPMHSKICFPSSSPQSRFGNFQSASPGTEVILLPRVCSKSFGKCSMPSCMSSLNTSSFLWKACTTDTGSQCCFYPEAWH